MMLLSITVRFSLSSPFGGLTTGDICTPRMQQVSGKERLEICTKVATNTFGILRIWVAKSFSVLPHFEAGTCNAACFLCVVKLSLQTQASISADGHAPDTMGIRLPVQLWQYVAFGVRHDSKPAIYQVKITYVKAVPAYQSKWGRTGGLEQTGLLSCTFW